MEAKIFLGERRGLTRSETHQSFHTFNFGSYQHDDRGPFKKLVTFNDDALSPLSSLSYGVHANHFIFLVPVIGGIQYSISSGGDSHFIEAGQCAGISAKTEIVLTIANPYETEFVNFVCGWISAGELHGVTINTQSFDVDQEKNKLLNAFDCESVQGLIGKFEGRVDKTVSFSSATNSFVFVIEGAFEVQERLLHARDGLALGNIAYLEFEALSNDAILLIINFSEPLNG